MMSLLQSRKFRRNALQALFLAGVVLVVLTAFLEGRQNLAAQGITTGFDFLDRATGFDVGFTLIPYTSFSPYSRLILVGLVNTLFLGMIGIVLANVVGLIVACLRTARNATFNLIGTIYIETIRNIPMILQAVFWYALWQKLRVMLSCMS